MKKDGFKNMLTWTHSKKVEKLRFNWLFIRQIALKTSKCMFLNASPSCKVSMECLINLFLFHIVAYFRYTQQMQYFVYWIPKIWK